MDNLNKLEFQSRKLLQIVKKEPTFLIDISFMPPEYSEYKKHGLKSITETMEIIKEYCTLFNIDTPTQSKVEGFVDGGNVFTLVLKEGSTRRNKKNTYLICHYNNNENWKSESLTIKK